MTTTRPLLVSSDPELIDDVLRLAAANNVEVHLTTDAEAARARWSSAPLVLVGTDLADQVAITRPLRRRDVLLLTREASSEDWQRAVGVGAEHVVALPTAERWLIDRLADSSEGASRGGAIVAIAGAGAGSGASTFAITLALAAAARSLRVLLVDADPGAGGLDLLLGIEGEPGSRWEDLAGVRGRVSATELESSLPGIAGVTVLSAGRSAPAVPGRSPDGHQVPPDGVIPAEAVTAVLDAGERGFDLVVVDLPRESGEVADAVLARARQVLLVVANHVRPVAAAARLAGELAVRSAGVGIVIRRDGDGVADEAIRSVLGLTVVGQLPRASGLAARADDGELPSLRDAYGRACAEVVDLLVASTLRRSA